MQCILVSAGWEMQAGQCILGSECWQVHGG